MEKNMKKCITNTLSFCYISEVNAILQTNYSFIFWKFVAAVLGLIAQSCPTVCNPIDCNPPGSSVHGDSPGKITGVGCHTFFQKIFPTQSLNPGLPHCRQFIYHLSGKPKNTGAGSPRILERTPSSGVFPTQELNWSLLHCRQILHKLSYWGSLSLLLLAGITLVIPDPLL